MEALWQTLAVRTSRGLVIINYNIHLPHHLKQLLISLPLPQASAHSVDAGPGADEGEPELTFASRIFFRTNASCGCCRRQRVPVHAGRGANGTSDAKNSCAVRLHQRAGAAAHAGEGACE